MRYRRWLRLLHRYWLREFGRDVFKAFPQFDFEAEYRAGHSWVFVSAKLTKWLPYWQKR